MGLIDVVQSWLPTLPAFAVLPNSSCPAQIFYAKNCRKAISVGDRVFNTRREEVAEVIGFDHMDDPVVVKPNQLRSAWPRCVIERLTSIGDRVHLCETMGTVEGFDEDGDFKVKMSNGQPVVWYAHKCKQGIGCLPKKSLADELLEELGMKEW